MLDFFQACASALITARRRSPPVPGRDALLRLATAIALIAAVFGALDWHASGAPQTTTLVSAGEGDL